MDIFLGIILYQTAVMKYVFLSISTKLSIFWLVSFRSPGSSIEALDEEKWAGGAILPAHFYNPMYHRAPPAASSIAAGTLRTNP